jgi:predicted NAD/FAD-binding protein
MNPGEIDPRRVVAEYAYEHPLYGFETLAAQQQVRTLQGARGIYYAGAHLGYGFHEDGFRSGAEVARLLGAMPWESAA